MGISLFKHNEDAYKSVIAQLQKSGKAAVIHPTGTGKSFIGFKLCEDNPDKTVCWLSPSQYIFSTQLENLKSVTDGYAPQNIRFYTYAKLMNMTSEEIDEIKPDYIVLDEFHRCGADMWGQGVDRLINRYPDVPMLGLSATAIRYLDNQRDMSDELFDGHIASHMTLGEAIVRGILKSPKYVLSIFSYKDELERYEIRVRGHKSKAVRDKSEEYLEQLRRAIDKAEGMDVIFDKHMTDRRGKYIVFCANYEAMSEAKDKCREWFHLIDEETHIYSVYTEDADAEKEFARFKADEDKEHLRLLYCIDALNEGVHVEDISGVILLRPTVSPIIYKQQIGRALSASKRTEPVIFDIVNNIRNLYSIDSLKEEMQEALGCLRVEGEDKRIVNESFEVIDELSNCLELFEALEDTLTAGWDIMYLEAKRYFEDKGNLLVPADHITETGYSLGRWIRTQRMSRAAGDTSLTQERIAKLDAIGMCWKSVSKERWQANYELAKAYYKEHGNLAIAHDYTVQNEALKVAFDEGISRIGIWISSQRDAYAKGRLSDEQIRLLEDIGMSWDRFDEKWERGYVYACRYMKEQGDINFIPKGFRYGDFDLSKWLHTQRNSYKTGKLTVNRIKRLEEIGMRWSINEAFWEKGYMHAYEYKQMHGNLKVPKDYVCADGFKLKSWMHNQINRHKKGNLTNIQVSKLETIGLF